VRKASLAIVAALLGSMGFAVAPSLQQQANPVEPQSASQNGSQPAPKAPLPNRTMSIAAAIRQAMRGTGGLSGEAPAKPNGGRRHARVKPMVASRTKPRKRVRCKVKRRAHK